MAAIDKSLPNEVRTDIKLPNPKEVQQEQQQQVAGDMMNPVDIQKNEDGSVDINFDPNAVNPGDTKDHFSNLAELLPDNVLDPLGHELTIIIRTIRLQEQIGKSLIQTAWIF